MRLILQNGVPDLDIADPDLGLTPSQQAACELDRETLVRAGAGVGKTHTLAARFLRCMVAEASRCLRDPHHPRPSLDSVLLLTFTEKAAGEMADRCRSRLLKLVRDLGAEGTTRPDGMSDASFRTFRGSLGTLLDAFEGARISTFHSFCARTLREFPAETGAPANFDVLDEQDSRDLLEECLDKSFRGHLDGADPDLALLLDALGGRQGLLEATRALILRREVLEGRIQAHAEGTLPLSEWLSQASLRPDQLESRISDPLLCLLAEILAVSQSAPSTPFFESVRRVHERLALPPGEPCERYDAYRDVLETLLPGSKAKAMSHHTAMGRKEQWKQLGGDPAYKKAKESLDSLKERITGLSSWYEEAAELPNRLDPPHWRVLGALSRFTLKTLSFYRESLSAQGLLDFAELQVLLSRAVTRGSDLARTLSERHQRVMVDEFQDTDVLQWSILSAIARPLGRPEGRLFLVGDPQQAIYGFRGGDVTVFTEVERELASWGFPAIELARNFRSRPRLIQWFNNVFHPILGDPSPSRPPYEASFQALEVGRKAEGGSVTVSVHQETTGEGGALYDARATGALLSSEILPPEGALRHLDLMNRERHPSPPVAILLRRRTWLGHMEHELRACGVPYVVAGGIGFWRRPEILDVANTLHALCTQDRISLVGALRSPIFCLKDLEILSLSTSGRLDGFGLRGLTREGDGAAAQAAAEKFTLLRGLRHRLPASRFLDEFFEICEIPHVAWSSDPSGQVSANLERLREMASHFDTMGGAGLPAFARRLLDRIDEPTREEQASIAPDEARVLILTIHAAKGLEFPVVIVPDLAAAPRRDTSSLLIARNRGIWSFGCTISDSNADVLDRASPGLREAIRLQRAKESAAEDRRLLYVACTRACDHLFLIGGWKPDSPQNQTWSQLLGNQGWGATEHKPSGIDPRTPEECPSTDPFFRLLRCEELVSGLLPPPTTALPHPSPELLRQIAPVSCISELALSPSSLDLFASCPARWMLRVQLRVPEAQDGPRPRARALAAVRGTVIHALLEEGVTADIPTIQRRWLAEARRAGASAEEIEQGLQAVLTHLAKANGDSELTLLREARGWNEAGFHLPMEGVRLTGTIDRLCQEPSSTTEAPAWMVLDYKTSGIHEDLESEATRYRRQLLTYSLAAWRILGQGEQDHDEVPAVGAAVYFTEPGRLVRLASWTLEDMSALRHLLRDIGSIARGERSWAEVEEWSTRDEQDRPCSRCGYHLKGCRGVRKRPRSQA